LGVTIADAVAVTVDDVAAFRAAPVIAGRATVITGLTGVYDAVSAPLEGAVRPATVAARVVPVVAGLSVVDQAVAAGSQGAQEGRDVVDLIRGDLDSPDEATGG